MRSACDQRGPHFLLEKHMTTITYVEDPRGHAITKPFQRNDDGSYEFQPLFLPSRITSHTEEIATAQQLYDSILEHAAQGHAMLKGPLNKDLVNERRKGQHNRTAKTHLVVFDFDKADIPTSKLDELLRHAGLGDVSYIAQLSASAGIKTPVKECLNLHVFMLSEDPIDPGLLKQFFERQNLDNPILRYALRLTPSEAMYTKPLDPVCARNAQPIFIAPPICENFEDPVKKRIHLVKKKHDQIPEGFAKRLRGLTPISQEDVRDTVNALREIEGLALLTKVQFRPARGGGSDGNIVAKGLGQMEVQIYREEYDTDFGLVTSMDLNGGDSHGYYVLCEHPKYVRNFKEEPWLELEQICPELHRTMVARANDLEAVKAQAKLLEADDEGRSYMAFREFGTDNFMMGWMNFDADEYGALDPWQFDVTRKAAVAIQHLEMHGKWEPPAWPVWRFAFDPTTDQCINQATSTINLWRPSEVWQQRTEATECPPTIYRLIHHVVGNNDKLADGFINALSFLMKERTQLRVAWFFQGTEGTGKGILFRKVIQPLIGHRHATRITMNTLERGWTDWIANSLFVFVDEYEAAAAGSKRRKLQNELKGMIAEERHRLDIKHKGGIDTQLRAMFMFGSNGHELVDIGENDRRFTICPRQEAMCPLTDDEIDHVLPTELRAFAGYLESYQTDVKAAHRAIVNAEKDLAREQATTQQESTIRALGRGDIVRICESLPSIAYKDDGHMTDSSITEQANHKEDYRRGRELILKILLMIKHNKDGKKLFLSTDDVFELYCIGVQKTPMGMQDARGKFKRTAGHYGLALTAQPNAGQAPMYKGRPRGRWFQWPELTPEQLLDCAHALGLDGLEPKDLITSVPNEEVADAAD